MSLCVKLMEIILCKVNYCINLICFDFFFGSFSSWWWWVEVYKSTLFDNFSISFNRHTSTRFQSILSVVSWLWYFFFVHCIQSGLLRFRNVAASYDITITVIMRISGHARLTTRRWRRRWKKGKNSWVYQLHPTQGIFPSHKKMNMH